MIVSFTTLQTNPNIAALQLHGHLKKTMIAMNTQVSKKYTASRQKLVILYILGGKNLTIGPQCWQNQRWPESWTWSIRIQAPSEVETNVSSNDGLRGANEKVNEYQWVQASGGLRRRATQSVKVLLCSIAVISALIWVKQIPRRHKKKPQLNTLITTSPSAYTCWPRSSNNTTTYTRSVW